MHKELLLHSILRYILRNIRGIITLMISIAISTPSSLLTAQFTFATFTAILITSYINSYSNTPHNSFTAKVTTQLHISYMQCAIRMVLIKLFVDNLFPPYKLLGTPLTDVTIGMYLNRISAVDENKEVSSAYVLLGGICGVLAVCSMLSFTRESCWLNFRKSLLMCSCK